MRRAGHNTARMWYVHGPGHWLSISDSIALRSGLSMLCSAEFRASQPDQCEAAPPASPFCSPWLIIDRIQDKPPHAEVIMINHLALPLHPTAPHYLLLPFSMPLSSAAGPCSHIDRPCLFPLPAYSLPFPPLPSTCCVSIIPPFVPLYPPSFKLQRARYESPLDQSWRRG